MRDPIEEYRERLAARRAETARLERIGDRIANLRFFVAVAGAVLIWACFGSPQVHPVWLLGPIGLFVVLVAFHERVVRRRELSTRAERFFERGVLRVTDEWAGRGNPGERYDDPAHPSAPDLDLFGAGSLFERIATVRTRAGEDALADWLREPAEAEEIRARQAAVKELAPRLDLREELALIGEDASVTIEPARLDEWGSAPSAGLPGWLPIAAIPLGLAGLVTTILWFAGTMGPGPMAGVVLVDLLLLAPFRTRITNVLTFADRPASELALVSLLLARLEAESFDSPRLAGLSGRLAAAGEAPSVRIRKLVRRQNLADSIRNPVFLPVAFLVLLPVHLAVAIERWRAASGRVAGDWLRAAGEIEALLAFAEYAFERPDDPFPEIVEEGGPLFVAKGATHPLLPTDRAVRNDVSIGGELRLLVVSGSNMSGKSTLLRTIGTNAVLALAGAPVTAEELRISPVRVAASMRVTDSLMEGASRFYAEITRLKQVVDLAGGAPPVLFLLDELLHGTNSHDRAAGAEGIVRGLVEMGAIGLVTTHDLALGAVAESLAPRAKNVHFEDRMEEDRMVFDYSIRPGVVQRSNALDLMRAIGLDV